MAGVVTAVQEVGLTSTWYSRYT